MLAFLGFYERKPWLSGWLFLAFCRVPPWHLLAFLGFHADLDEPDLRSIELRAASLRSVCRITEQIDNITAMKRQDSKAMFEYAFLEREKRGIPIMAIPVSPRIFVSAVLIGCTICQPAAAQQALCQAGEPPFATTPANQMKGPELRAWLPGKQFVALRRVGDSRQGIFRYGFHFRADGSVVFTCSEPSGRWCTTFKTSSGANRDVGVWKVEGNMLVLTRTHHVQEGRAEGRLSIHRQGSTYAAARTPGPHLCLPGLLTIESGAN